MSRKTLHARSFSNEFLSNAVIDTIVPEAQELDASDYLPSVSPLESEDDSQIAIDVPQRHSLFLDETLKVYIVLRTLFLEEKDLQSFLARLSVTLEVLVIGTKVQSSEGVTNEAETITDVISTHRVQDAEDPLVVVSESSTESANTPERYIYVLWKIKTHIARPKVRCSNPVIQFAPSATLRRPMNTQLADEDEYMPSGIPTSINLFQSFERDPEFKGNPPFLLASRLTKVAPAGNFGAELPKELKIAPRRSLRIVPAINSRLRFSRLGMSSNQAKVLASLDFEISPFVKEEITFQEVDLELSDGKAESLTPTSIISMPLKCHARDEVTFIHNLIPKRTPKLLNGGKSSPHTLSLSATATIPLSNDNHATIKLQWRTTVDLTHITKSQMHNSSSTTSSPNQDITITISGPPIVPEHRSFKWSILLANRSKTRSLRLALIPIPKLSTSAPGTSRPSMLTQLHQHKSILSSSSSTLAGDATKRGAQAGVKATQTREIIMDNATLYSLTHRSSGLASSSSAIDPVAIVPLSADVIMGPIPPGACQTAEMEFLVLKTGVVNLDAVRVVDLDSREGLDVIWLPDIVAVDEHDVKQTQTETEDEYESSS